MGIEGDPEYFVQEFPDQQGADDTREVIIEVRYASGTLCDTDAEYDLLVEGNVIGPP
jgi:hypothetical protein